MAKNQSTPTNADIMKVILNLQTTQSEILITNKKLANSQETQFNALGKRLKSLTKELIDLKQRYSALLTEIYVLKDKVKLLESNPSNLPSSFSLVAQIIQQTVERKQCISNVIVYGLSDLSSVSLP